MGLHRKSAKLQKMTVFDHPRKIWVVGKSLNFHTLWAFHKLFRPLWTIPHINCGNYRIRRKNSVESIFLLKNSTLNWFDEKKLRGNKLHVFPHRIPWPRSFEKLTQPHIGLQILFSFASLKSHLRLQNIGISLLYGDVQISNSLWFCLEHGLRGLWYFFREINCIRSSFGSILLPFLRSLRFSVKYSLKVFVLRK